MSLAQAVRDYKHYPDGNMQGFLDWLGLARVEQMDDMLQQSSLEDLVPFLRPLGGHPRMGEVSFKWVVSQRGVDGLTYGEVFQGIGKNYMVAAVKGLMVCYELRTRRLSDE
jgi:hypothetical protein